MDKVEQYTGITRPATLSPSGFAKILTAYGLTDHQQADYEKLMKRTKPLTDNMKDKVAKYEETLSHPFSQTAISYAEEVVQRLIGVEPDNYVSFDMQRGIELEPHAVAKYEAVKMVDVYGKERYYHHEYDFISGEPDGLVGEDGIIEVKCPNSANHFKNLLEGQQIEQYKWQIQGYMWLLDREWCDFCSYNPDYPDKYELSINRVVRDDKMIAELESRCVEFWNDIVLPLKKRVEAL